MGGLRFRTGTTTADCTMIKIFVINRKRDRSVLLKALMVYIHNDNVHACIIANIVAKHAGRRDI